MKVSTKKESNTRDNMGDYFYTVIGMVIDCMLLIQFLGYYSIKDNKKNRIFVFYSIYIFSNFLLSIFLVPFLLKTFINISMIIIIGNFLYERISYLTLIKEAIVFILLLGISELLIIPIIFLLTGNFDAEIFSDSSRPQLWVIGMGLSRFISIILFMIYRKTQKKNNDNIEYREALILYLPLLVSFFSFLIISKFILNMNQFKMEDVVIPLTIIAIILILLTLSHMISFEYYIEYREKDKKIKMLKQKNQLQYEYYKNQAETLENMRILYHDLKNHMIAASLDQNSYMNKIGSHIIEYEKFVDTGNNILNVLLWEKWNEASKKGISFEIAVGKINMDFMDELDICSIIGNLLDNAIEACEEVKNEFFPEIIVKINKVNNFLVIKVINDCIGYKKQKLRANEYKTTKQEENMHGVGLKSVKRAVTKYDGNYVFECKDNTFVTEVLIPDYQSKQ